MKKFLTVLAIAGTLVSCSDGADSTSSDDSMMTTPTTDSNMMTTPPMDTTGMGTGMDTTSSMSMDSMNRPMTDTMPK